MDAINLIASSKRTRFLLASIATSVIYPRRCVEDEEHHMPEDESLQAARAMRRAVLGDADVEAQVAGANTTAVPNSRTSSRTWPGHLAPGWPTVHP